MSVRLRKVAASDCDLLYAWRNDPYLVARSSSGRSVSRDEHVSWFTRMLADTDCLAFVVEIDHEARGQVRLERKDDHCVITAYLLPAWTGKGLGVEAIRAGCAAAAVHWPRLPLLACVRKDNAAGLAGFRKAGFREARGDCPQDHFAMFYAHASDAEAEAVRRYTRLLEVHGDSHRALDWGSPQGQQLRFGILAAIDELSSRSVLDVGCGLGGLATWLDERDIRARYTGLDLTPTMIERARRLHPAAEFHAGSILDPSVLAERRFDYVLASGIFATYGDDGETRLRLAVERMWAMAARGIAFNSLSAWAPDPEPGEYHADPAAVVSLARRLSPWVVLRHDYHPRDFTVYIYREPRR